MDEQLRKILRNVDDADPLSFIIAGRALERAGTTANFFSDLLERLLQAYDALYWRSDNTFNIAWMLRGVYRRTLHLTIQDGGILLIPQRAQRAIVGGTTPVHLSSDDKNFSNLLRMIIEKRRLAPPTSQFLQVIQDTIMANGANSCKLINQAPEPSTMGRIRRERVFDVVAKIDPKKDWRPDYNLRFVFVRSLYRDLLEVSIEDNLYWGTEHEVQGMRLTGTSFTLYGGEVPEYEPPGEPYTTYEIIDNIKELPALITEIFDRFRQI